ncbi:SpaH/EbpB family LPXTG-anchored major pilin [Clostridium sp. SHJSY1]|uniref:SpaH/EbpB family LPXTG-anchored major pilin n=1 Tax=Clostridium sp. SHJSY1 TaxID=2942483 RepID=UPI002876EC2E|nr:SpaH/EbpB family LPXTG-anchored major pilin [Clostridium sp. SHJSY1]MDS0526512.1 SpaH/EbpB family LPXTG-anchored major pilin [Clostridium sp. SHJSY1]
MKKFKKIFSFIIVFVMMFAMKSLSVYAAPPIPASTSVTIHKVVGIGGFSLHTHDGRLLTPAEIAALGTNAVENNNGVKFTVWPVPAGTQVSDFNGMSNTQVTDSTLTGDPVVVDAGVPVSFATGNYYVRETVFPSTIEYQIGVPFIMELPALNVSGDAYLGAVHLYPKNIISNDAPEIDKDIELKNQDRASYDVGHVFNYLIYPKVPKGIGSYTTFKISDVLPNTLNYVGNPTITYNGVTFVNGTDYNVTQDNSGTAAGSINITFTTAGLQKLESNRPNPQTLKDLEIKFQASINTTATMGAAIYNNASLTYNNGYMSADVTVNVPSGNQPEVHTGGRHFVKVDNVQNIYLPELAAATFAVKNGSNQYMAVDADGKISWVADLASAYKISINGSNGYFEVKGLAYGNTGDPYTYMLEEVNVPNGYVKMDDLTFTIDANSYGARVPVTNVKRPVIPPTGGIGTVIFLGAGLIIMISAIVVFKKKEESEK